MWLDLEGFCHRKIQGMTGFHRFRGSGSGLSLTVLF